MYKVDRVMTEELNYADKQISLWYRKNDKTLSILTIPFNTTLIFKEIILELIKEKEDSLSLG